MAPYIAGGTVEVEQTLRACRDNPFVLPEGALTASEVDWAAISNMKDVGLKLVALPHATLYQL